MFRTNFSAPGVFLSFTGILLLVLLLSACEPQSDKVYQPEYSTTSPLAGNKVYIFGVHPQRNPRMLRTVFGPMVDYLNQKLPKVTFVFEASRNFQSFDEKIDHRHFDFTLPNPYGTLRAIDHGYKVFGQMGNKGDLRGLIVVRQDSEINSVSDLKGKAMSFPAPTALAATIMPKYYLFSNGLNLNQDIEPKYVGSMESSLINIYMGNVAAGTVYPPAWRMFQSQHPETARELKVIWQTDPLPDNSLMARNDVPPELVEQVAQALFNMGHTPEGSKVLTNMDLSRFIPANNETYRPVREFIQRYEQQIGPVDAP